LEYFTIKNFRPVEVKEDSTDQDRTVLRLCEGLVPVPQGALSSGPEWKLLWGIDDLADRAATLLAAADQTKTHFLKLNRLDRTFIIAWSCVLSRALGIFEVVSAPLETELDATDNVVLTAPADAAWRDKDGTAAWFASPIGDRWLLGNGIDANLQWRAAALTVFGPATPPADIYNLGRIRIPPCTCFRMNEARNLFATGNADLPMRVWITEAPTVKYPFFDGIQSLDVSFIDVPAHGGATAIRAMSLYQSYITLHTDRAPINVYGVNGTSDGWKCQSAASAANASALNPDCVGDAEGDASFYLGTDLEVYSDQAVRSGPWEKRGARAQEIVTEQGSEVWNRDMQRSGASRGYALLYDRDTRLAWIFARSVFAGRSMLWLYNERTRTCAGPIHYPDVTCATSLRALKLPHTRLGGISGLQIGSTFGVG
jgi:hypothetical protein